MNNANEPAYPVLDTPEYRSVSIGLTKRELIAAMAMQGLLANPEYREKGYDDIATYSIKHADELLKQLNP